MKKLVLLLAMLVVSVPCFAADESTLLGKLENGNVYVIPDTYETHGSDRSVWLDLVYNDEGKKDFDKKIRKRVHESRSKYSVTCWRKELTREAFVLFDKNGRRLDDNLMRTTEIVVPGTFGDNLFKFLCAKKEELAVPAKPESPPDN